MNHPDEQGDPKYCDADLSCLAGSSCQFRIKEPMRQLLLPFVTSPLRIHFNNAFSSEPWLIHLMVRTATQWLRAGCPYLVPVMLDVQFCGLCCVVRRVVQMALRCMSVMRGRFVIAAFVVPGGFTMMPRRVFVMFCCFMVMLRRVL